MAKEVYNPKAFILHAASLDQAFAHCQRFPVAAIRRCMARVSVPLWLIILSDQLPVVALVGFYPTNKLMGRRLLLKRPVKSFNQRTEISDQKPENRDQIKIFLITAY